MGKYLYCVPMGENARNLLYEKLKQVPYHESIMILPNRRLVDVAQREGKVNSAVWDILLNTILGYKKDVKLLKVRTDIAVLIIKDILKDEANYPYFAQLKDDSEDSLADVEGLAISIYRFLVEAMQHGVDLEKLKSYDESQANSGNEKDKLRTSRAKELCAIFKEYKKRCVSDDYQIVGLQERYELAIDLLQNDKCVEFPYRVIAFSDIYEYSEPQLKIISLLKKRLGIKVYVALSYEETRSNIYSLTKSRYLALTDILGDAEFIDNREENTDLQKLSKLYNAQFEDKKIFVWNGPKDKCPANKSIHISSFINREQEMRWVLSDVKDKLKTGAKVEDIVVAVRDLRQYSGLVDIADEYGIPVNRALTTSLVSQPIAEFVHYFVTALKDNAEGAAAYFKMLGSSLLKLNKIDLPEDVEFMTSERYFTSRKQAQQAIAAYYIKAEERYNKYKSAAEAKGEEYNKKKLEPSKVVKAIDNAISQYDSLDDAKLEAFIAPLNELLNLVADRKLYAKLYKENLLRLEELKFAILAKDNLMDVLKNRLELYKKIACDAQYTVGKFYDLVEDVLNTEKIVLRSGRRDGIRFCSVTELGGEHIPYIYLLGNREDVFPCPAKRRWLYTEQEREDLAKLGVKLEVKKTDYDYDVMFFAQTIFSAEKELYLTWFRDAGVSDSDAGCSIFVDYVKQYFDDVDYKAEKYEGVCSKQEQAVLTLNDVDKRDDNNYVGVNLEKELGQLVWQKLVKGKFSASGLEEYRKCPLRYLASRVWNADARKELDDTPDRRHVGTLIHDVYETFIKERIAAGKKKFADTDHCSLEKSLAKIFEDKVQQYEKNGYFGGPLWSVTKQELKKKTLDWLHYEENRDGVLANFWPCAAEWEFGYGNEPAYPVKVNECYGKESEQELNALFCGKVDRFDTDGEKQYIIDYKTGIAPTKDDLQIPLYILAVNALYEGAKGKAEALQGGSYLELKDMPLKKSEVCLPLKFKNGKRSTAKDAKTISYDESLEYLHREFLTKYVDNIHKGNFTIPKEHDCKYCVLSDYCKSGKGDEDND